MISQLTAAPDIAAARQLIEGSGLSFEAPYDELVGLHEGECLVGVGARAGRILKMLAVAPAHRGGSALGEIVSALVSRGLEAGIAGFFVFTKPQYATSFEALNFSLLASHDKVALLEFGGGFRHWLAAHEARRRPGLNGAVVINGNPFSPDDRDLVERAAAQVDHLYLFVVRKHRSPLPYAEHYRLVEDGVRDLAKLSVIDSADYSLDAASFPTYFLKPDDPVARIRMELDATLFATRIAPHFGITRRFVGSAPDNPADDPAYTAILRRQLPTHGIALTEIEPQSPRR